MTDPFEIAQEVKTALARNRPVVALESTVIAHGLPGEKGVEAALAMMDEIRSHDVTPAAVGIIDGKITIGLSEDEIRRLATAEGVLKVSTREVPAAVFGKHCGATTVAATLHVAASTGVAVMATGGIGGVHRGAAGSFDISADLWELAGTSGIVVCSGAKPVLDLPATIEWLETHQVPVYGYGTEEFPAFYSPASGLSVQRLDGSDDVSEVYLTRIGLGLRGAMVVAVPIPAEDAVDISEAVDQAVAEAKEQGIKGAALTPWLLSRVQELSGGAAVDANIALLRNNAGVAAEIAAALAGRRDKRIGFQF